MSGDKGAWRPLPVDGALAPEADEVHVWRMDLMALAERIGEFGEALNADERERAARFYFERDRVRYQVTRGALRRVLGAWLGVAAEGIEFSYGAQGKPYIEGAQLQFNVSHSGDLALIAVTRRRAVGVDVEQWRAEAVREIAAETIYFGGELQRMRAAGEAGREAMFFRLWTLKEAVVKAMGGGLSIALDRFEVAPGEGAGGKARMVRMYAEGGEAGEWSLRDLEVGDGYSAALAVRGIGIEPRLRLWDLI